MPVPDYQTLMRPLLAFGADGSEKDIKDAIAKLAEQFNLKEEDLSQLVPSGKSTVFSNRVHWARTYLIDGEQLADFMIQYGVGVRTERTIEIKKTDTDYFDDSAE